MNTPETTKEAMLSLEVMRLNDRCKQLEADIAILRNERRFQAAKAAMQGILSCPFDAPKKYIASEAVKCADALLKELEK